MNWQCATCGKFYEEKPESCPKCGGEEFAPVTDKALENVDIKNKF